VQAHDADLDSWAGVTRASGFDTFAATPSSANLAGLVSDETGSGALVFANSPTLVTPALGTPASGVVTNLTGTASININGTVGATTPNTGAFTMLKASQSSPFGSFGSSAAIVVQNTDASAFNASEFRALDSGGNVAGGLSIRNATHGVSGSSDAFIVVKNAGTLVAPVSISSTGLAVTGALSSTTGANFATSSGNVGIGTASPTARLTVTNNAAALETGLATTVAHFAGADSTVARITLDSFGSSASFASRRANGTAASKSAVLEGEALFSIGSGGYKATEYHSGLSGFLFFTAAENWTDSAIGTNASILLVPKGSLAQTTAFQFTSEGEFISPGNVGIGTTSPVTLKSSVTLQVLGNTKLGNANDRGLLSLGDIGSNDANVGVWRGAAGAYGAAGSFLCLGGFDGITFVTGNSEISTQTERLRITSAGNVGIGTTSPGSKLDVDGELRIGNTVAAAVAVASTHKVTIVIGGITYYLLASDV
jgi:hypothetical protein